MRTLRSGFDSKNPRWGGLLIPSVWASSAVFALGAMLASGDAMRQHGTGQQLVTNSPLHGRSSLAAGESLARLPLSELIAHLETEASRLDTAFRGIDQQATELLGPADSQKRRTPKLPSEQSDLVRYLGGCIGLAERLSESFAGLVVGEGHVDLRDRAVDARTNLQRLEQMGPAGVLVRRQIRSWVEKDMEAVDALYAEWPQINSAVGELIVASKQFERGQLDGDAINQAHAAVVRASALRTQFADSRLGLLCRNVHEAAGRQERHLAR